MTSYTVSVDPLGMLPLYACIFTSTVLTCIALPVQARLMAFGAGRGALLRTGLGTRLGSALLIFGVGATLMALEVAVLVPLTGGTIH